MSRFVFCRTGPVMKSADDNYKTPQKCKARQFVIDAVLRSGVEVKSILTLPGREALCVKEFQKHWPRPETTYVGIEGHSTRLKSSVISHLLDSHLGITFSEMTMKKSALIRGPDRQPSRSMAPVRTLVPASATGKASYGPFDFSYLDFCGYCSQNTVDDVRRFLPMVREGGVIGLTFSLGKTHANEIVAKLSVLPVVIDGYYEYRTSSDMMVVVIRKPVI